MIELCVIQILHQQVLVGWDQYEDLLLITEILIHVKSSTRFVKKKKKNSKSRSKRNVDKYKEQTWNQECACNQKCQSLSRALQFSKLGNLLNCNHRIKYLSHYQTLQMVTVKYKISKLQSKPGTTFRQCQVGRGNNWNSIIDQLATHRN